MSQATFLYNASAETSMLLKYIIQWVVNVLKELKDH